MINFTNHNHEKIPGVVEGSVEVKVVIVLLEVATLASVELEIVAF